MIITIFVSVGYEDLLNYASTLSTTIWTAKIASLSGVRESYSYQENLSHISVRLSRCVSSSLGLFQHRQTAERTIDSHYCEMHTYIAKTYRHLGERALTATL